MIDKTLWILTEERPKREVLHWIISQFCKDYRIAIFINHLKIIPVFSKIENRFEFKYKVIGFDSEEIKDIQLFIVSGSSSFVDYLVFYQKDIPKIDDVPIYAIEETKTSDGESRNTGIAQRASKFVFLESIYPTTKAIMLYTLQVQENEKKSNSNIFGAKCFSTFNVQIEGKSYSQNIDSFKSVDELINLKNSMKQPPKGNVPIRLNKYLDRIEISGRLVKDDSLSHDPNIGTLSLISHTLRKLGWDKKIIITQHGLTQRMLNNTNKFIRIANALKIELEGLNIPKPGKLKDYWHYESGGEKLATIFLHLAITSFSEGRSIYENHAGCERGYFQNKLGKKFTIPKYKDKELYKSGNKNMIIHIPDLVIDDPVNLEIINIEGKKFKNMSQGILDLENFDYFDTHFVKHNYPEYRIIRTVALFGSENDQLTEQKVSFLLNNKGQIILNSKGYPKIFGLTLENLFEYWAIEKRHIINLREVTHES